MQLVKAHAEAPAHGQCDGGEQAGAIGIEQVIQGTPEAIVAERSQRGSLESERTGLEAVDAFVLAVDGLALDQQAAQQYAQRAGVGEGYALAGGGDELLEQFVQSEAVQKVIDEGSGPRRCVSSANGEGRLEGTCIDRSPTLYIA